MRIDSAYIESLVAVNDAIARLLPEKANMPDRAQIPELSQNSSLEEFQIRQMITLLINEQTALVAAAYQANKAEECDRLIADWQQTFA